MGTVTMLKTSVITAAILLFFAAPFSLRAQTTPELPIPQDIMTQQMPAIDFDQFSVPSVELVVSASGAPGSIAGIRALTANIDNNTSSFDWYLDDQPALFASGKAKTDFSFQTTKPFHIVRLVISSEGKKIAENTASISSFAVSLIWNTDTFVPADYRGKPLPSLGSSIIVTAFPEMRGESPENLLYTWYIDAESQVRNILGEQEFSFVALKNKAFVSVMVEVSNLSQSIMASKAIVIPLMKPSVIIAPSEPISLSRGGRVEMTAQPFYFHARTINTLSYEWFFGGKSIFGTPPDPNTLSLFISEESRTGLHYLRLRVANSAVPGEEASTDIPITIF